MWQRGEQWHVSRSPHLSLCAQPAFVARPPPCVPATSTFNGKDGLERYHPDVLAWKLTIHKVQGISLDKAVIDLGSDTFNHGQVFVALGRVRRLESVLLIGLLVSFKRLAGCPITGQLYAIVASRWTKIESDNTVCPNMHVQSLCSDHYGP